MDEKKDHKWGFSDSNFMIHSETNEIEMTGDRYLICGYKMPNFLNFIRDEFKLEKLETQSPLKEVKYSYTRSKLDAESNSDKKEKIVLYLSENKIEFSIDNKERLIHSHGQTSAYELHDILYIGEGINMVDLVVFPKSKNHIESIIKLANDHHCCLVPYGGGTNVSHALLIPKTETRIIISVDMRNMNKMIVFNKRDNFAEFEAGITGKRMEELLNDKGYTSGHEPDSLEFSTLGGWVSTNASGMKKTKYGNIEDIVINYSLHTPSGTIKNFIDTPRNSHGSQLDSLIFGSEGNFGIISTVKIKIHMLPQKKLYQSLLFRDFKTGKEFLENLNINYSELIPASIRLVDNLQFRFALALKPKPTLFKKVINWLKDQYINNYCGFENNRMVLCTITYEGKEEDIKYKMQKLENLALEHDGVIGGSENGKKGYQLTYAIAYIRDLLSSLYIIGETFETSVSWKNIDNMLFNVEKELRNFNNYNTLLTYRITQTYRTGVCIYFMLGMYHKNIENVSLTFHNIEDKLRKTIIKYGGSISHHHGIGKHRSKYIKEKTNIQNTSIIKTVKSTIDPNNIFAISNNILNIE